jgi:hypothetical protein
LGNNNILEVAKMARPGGNRKNIRGRSVGPIAFAGYGEPHADFEFQTEAFSKRAARLLESTRGNDPKKSAGREAAKRALSRLLTEWENNINMDRHILKATNSEPEEKIARLRAMEINRARFEMANIMCHGAKSTDPRVMALLEKINRLSENK